MPEGHPFAKRSKRRAPPAVRMLSILPHAADGVYAFKTLAGQLGDFVDI